MCHMAVLLVRGGRLSAASLFSGDWRGSGAADALETDICRHSGDCAVCRLVVYQKVASPDKTVTAGR